MKYSKFNKFRSCLAGSVLAAAAGLAANPAAAIDVSPGDYAVLPSGTNLGLYYFQYGSSNHLSVDGVGDIPDSKLDTAVSLLRILHYSDFDGLPVLYQAVLPIGFIPTARIGGFDQDVSDGMGDLSLGFTTYPIHSSEPTGTTIGLTGFLTMPTGNYDADDISLGSGTWTFTPQIGIQQGLGNGFFFDTYADVAFELDHNENGNELSRNPSVQLQTYLRYQFDPKTSVSFGYVGHYGGDAKVNDVSTGLKVRSDELRLYANTFVTPTVQVQGMVGTDLSVEGGFKDNVTLQLRLLKVF